MGYTTEFDGYFKLSRQLTETEKEYIQKFNDIRHMRRDVDKLHKVYNGKYGNPFAKTREEVYGREGEYFVGGDGIKWNSGEEIRRQDETILDYNAPPCTPVQSNNSWKVYWNLRQNMIATGQAVPGLWCQWTVDKAGTRLEWDGGEKFYYYSEWLKYLITHFFDKWGVKLTGIVYWQGEDREDSGKLEITNNILSITKAKHSYD